VSYNFSGYNYELTSFLYKLYRSVR